MMQEMPASYLTFSFFYTGTISSSKICHQKRINCDTTDFATKSVGCRIWQILENTPPWASLVNLLAQYNKIIIWCNTSSLSFLPKRYFPHLIDYHWVPYRSTCLANTIQYSKHFALASFPTSFAFGSTYKSKWVPAAAAAAAAAAASQQTCFWAGTLSR